MKKCFRCGEIKPIIGYPKCKQNRDGYSGVCFDCTRIGARKYYEANREKILSDRRKSPPLSTMPRSSARMENALSPEGVEIVSDFLKKLIAAVRISGKSLDVAYFMKKYAEIHGRHKKCIRY